MSDEFEEAMRTSERVEMKLRALVADLAAARAEVEWLKVDAVAEAKRELVADVLSKTPEDVKERVRLYTQRRLADLRERCARMHSLMLACDEFEPRVDPKTGGGKP